MNRPDFHLSVVSDPAGTVTALVPRDRMLMDADPIARLFLDLGEGAAEEVICRALEDMTSRLGRINALHAASNFAPIGADARRLSAIAAQLGLTEVATVALYACDCAENGNAMGLGAVLARLDRICDHAVTEVWSLRGTAG
jgi:hypothetical protein